jgi:hypothetical protein
VVSEYSIEYGQKLQPTRQTEIVIASEAKQSMILMMRSGKAASALSVENADIDMAANADSKSAVTFGRNIFLSIM